MVPEEEKPKLRNTNPVSAKEFRRRVLRPVEGVFLFHPRALERLIHQHLKSGLLARRIPALGYYLIPREVFLLALEDENPDALSVIEGLFLPKNVILLPMPLARERALLASDRLFQNYWGQRFEAEMARAWHSSRYRGRDREDFGAPGLKALLGESAFKEIRAILEHDKQMILGQDDEQVCRHFIGLISRMRYFAPGIRGCFFPAIRCWRLLDCWMRAGGAEVPVGDEKYPALLNKSRPGMLEGDPHCLLKLPLRPQACREDPDRAPLIEGCTDPEQAPSLPMEQTPTNSVDADAAGPNPYARILQDCREKIRNEQHQGLWARFVNRFRTAGAWLRVSLSWAFPELIPHTEQDAARTKKGLRQLYREFAFRRHIEFAQRADQAGDVTRALQMVLAGRRDYRGLMPDADTRQDPLWTYLQTWRMELAERFSDQFIHTWDLSDELASRIRSLVEAATQEHNSAALPHHQEMQLIGRLGRSMVDRATRFSQPRLFSWLFSFGYHRLRQPLPFHGRLKGLRALRGTRAYLTRLPWTHARFRFHSETLERIDGCIAAKLRADLSPLIQTALAESGFTPGEHREQVAFRKIREELLDVILQHWHLRFADVRDAIARNDLRLHDPSAKEIWFGDKLTRLDKHLGRTLPRLYRRGEFYIQGLQHLSSPLFGTDKGRLITRYGIVPFGAALISLEAIGHLMQLLVFDHPVAFLTPWSLLGLGILLNIFIYTEHGKRFARRAWHGLKDLVSFVFYRGFQRLLAWEPVARLLRNHTLREISRYVLEPLLIGAVVLLPAGLLLMLHIPLGPLDRIGGDRLLLVVVSLGFVAGNFLRNTQPGRHILDAVMVQFVVAWNQFRYTFVVGLIQSILQFFARIMDGINQALYLVDDWVRSRMHEPFSLVMFKSLIKPVLGGVSYAIQFYVTVLIEPQINPIKHFPVVTVSHKLMLPLLPMLTGLMLTLTEPFLPAVVAIPFVTLTIFLLPGLFGFLVWELKENWRLYQANHPDRVKPVLVGRHGENLRGMLRRGFHSGTVPKAYDRLRKVLIKAGHRGWTQPAKLYKAEQQLMEASHEIERLLCRELICSLRLWCREPEHYFRDVQPGGLHLATSSLEMVVLIQTSEQAERPVRLLLYYRIEHGELLARTRLQGDRPHLEMHQRRILRDDVERFLLRTGARYQAERLDFVFGTTSQNHPKALDQKVGCISAT